MEFFVTQAPEVKVDGLLDFRFVDFISNKSFWGPTGGEKPPKQPSHARSLQVECGHVLVLWPGPMLGNETGFDMEKNEITKRSLSVWEPFFKQRNIHESVQWPRWFRIRLPSFSEDGMFHLSTRRDSQHPRWCWSQAHEWNWMIGRWRSWCN